MIFPVTGVSSRKCWFVLNVLYLHAHDAGRWLAPYAAAFDTPNAAAFSRGAVTFDEAYCAGPTCSPSRAALLTGQWAHRTGMLGLTHRGFSLRRPERHLARVLRGAGYDTVLSGVQHEQWGVPDFGYDTVLAQEDSGFVSDDAAVADAAAAWLRRRGGGDGGGTGGAAKRPFFMSCGFHLPHRPFDHLKPADETMLSKAAVTALLADAGLPDTEQTRTDVRLYATAVTEADRCFGVVLDALDAAGLTGDTVVLLTTDHGPAFPGMKCQLYDGGTGVTMMLRTPDGAGGFVGAGRRCGALVSQVDVMPTLGELLGFAPPEGGDGVSLRPLLEGAAGRVRDELFTEVTWHAAYEPQRAVRTDTHKLIRHYDAPLPPPRANVDDGLTKDAAEAAGYFSRARPRTELYDLAADPRERNDVAEDPAYAGVRRDLEARLDRWMAETGDPLCGGGVPRKPPGAMINRRTHVSPAETDWEPA